MNDEFFEKSREKHLLDSMSNLDNDNLPKNNHVALYLF